jgi:hypothetical protein
MILETHVATAAKIAEAGQSCLQSAPYDFTGPRNDRVFRLGRNASRLSGIERDSTFTNITLRLTIDPILPT